MLTFEFTGVEGRMTESEALTSGMVGKTVALRYDASWNNLTKTVVFRAGDTSRVVISNDPLLVIPEEVLQRPFCKLYVGVWGTDAGGNLVIPTIMAEGPLIRYGADPIEVETARKLPVWQDLQNQIGSTALLETEAKSDLVSAINEVLSGQDCIGDPAALNTGAKNTLVAAINEVLSGQDCIGDPAGLNTAAKNTLVAAINEVLAGQDAIGNPTNLKTNAKNTLVAAVNEVLSGQNCIGSTAALNTRAKDTLVAAINEVLSGQNAIGNTGELDTEVKTTLVAAVNEVLGLLGRHIRETVCFTSDSAQLLIDILAQGTYRSNQAENIAALATALGAAAPTEEILLHHWDFRSGGLTDLVGGLTATAAEDVTLDGAGAHTVSTGSYIMFPLGADGATLGDNILEIKFGLAELPDRENMRLAMICKGAQPASLGLTWNYSHCWAGDIMSATEFTDPNMFSGKVLTGRTSADGTGIDWYLEDTCLCTVASGSYVPTHVSLGSSSNAAYPVTVEYIKIRPGA